MGGACILVFVKQETLKLDDDGTEGMQVYVTRLTCWKRMSMSKVSGSLGWQTGGMLNSPLGDAMQGTILTV